MDAEADVSTQEAKANAHARFPGTQCHIKWEASAESSSAEGPATACRVQGMVKEMELEGEFAAPKTKGLGPSSCLISGDGTKNTAAEKR